VRQAEFSWFGKRRELLGAGEWSEEGLSRMEMVVEGFGHPPERIFEHTSGQEGSKALL
jgi:hypothetical protein